MSSSTSPSIVRARTDIHDGPVPALVLRCGGEIDSSCSGELATAVGDALAEIAADGTSTRILVVDLREVTFFGASAITALLVGAAAAPSATLEPRLVVGGNRQVGLVLDVLDLRTTFSIHHDVTAALGDAPPAAPA